MKVIFMVDLICSDELFQYHTLKKKKKEEAIGADLK